MEIVNVSVDRLTFLGGVSDKRLLDELRFNHFVRGQGRAKFPYDYTWYMEDGSVLQLATPNADVRPLRYDFNPNKWDAESNKDYHVMSILRCMKNVVLSRLDVAIDVIGEDLGKYDWHDRKARKREIHEDGRRNIETIYIGAERAVSRLRIYNKEKERQDKEKVSKWEKWWRVEAQMRGEDADSYLESNPFADVAVLKKYDVDENGVKLEYDITTKAILYYLSQFPNALGELSKNSRSKYKQLLAATRQPIAESSFSEIYERSKEQVREVVDTFRNLTLRTWTEKKEINPREVDHE